MKNGLNAIFMEFLTGMEDLFVLIFSEIICINLSLDIKVFLKSPRLQWFLGFELLRIVSSMSSQKLRPNKASLNSLVHVQSFV